VLSMCSSKELQGLGWCPEPKFIDIKLSIWCFFLYSKCQSLRYMSVSFLRERDQKSDIQNACWVLSMCGSKSGSFCSHVQSQVLPIFFLLYVLFIFSCSNFWLTLEGDQISKQRECCHVLCELA
jgi:hypothetical protein